MKPYPQIVGRILEIIRQHRTFCVVGHVRPDGDCLGSQLALTLALRAEGKDVVCWNQDPVPSKLKFLDPDRVVQRPRSGQSFDCVISVDAASYERLGTVCDDIQDRKILVNIDHHTSNTKFGDINWISAEEASSGELVTKLIRAGEWKLTPQMANCLFAAVSTDTGSFQYASTKPATFETAADLVEAGADLGEICHEVYHSHPLSRVRLLRHVYSKFKLTANDRLAYCWLRKRDFSRAGAEREEAEGLIDKIREIEPVIVAVIFEEMEPELTRISFRSKDERVDVNAVAQQFGGGGHKAAAGARVEGTPLAVQRRVVAALKRELKAGLKKD
jgi:bifunctional oligoribonuclease and PAP phosphatase NrnA